MLTFALGMIFVGGLLLYAGWEGKKLDALLTGDNRTAATKPSGEPRLPLGAEIAARRSGR